MIPSQFQVLANHLWQSTLFAVAAWLLTLVLRKNRAEVRHWVWLAASVKFLIPFSLLINLGSHFPGHAVTSVGPSSLPEVAEQVSQPFAERPTLYDFCPPMKTGYVSWIPTELGALWIAGSVILISSWARRWHSLRKALRDASPLDLGGGVRARISTQFTEPGVFGIFRPVLLLPVGISDRLTSDQFKAIVGHELCHIRRRDNLAAAIHMGVEALFWFHPLVWWLGARLMEERERACDAEVLLMGNDPEAYAEGILAICDLYLKSSLPCVAGVTGANLRRRVEEIMRKRIGLTLSGTRKTALITAAMVALAAPIAVGILKPPSIRAQSAAGTLPKFEVASVKEHDKSSSGGPNSNFPLGPGDVYVRNGGLFLATGWGLPAYIAFAYKLMGSQIQYMLQQLPDWAKFNGFDIQARTQGDPSKDQMRRMMRSLLADRFKLAVHYEDRQLPVFAWVLAKSQKTGPQLQPHVDMSPCPTEMKTSSEPTIWDGSPAFCDGIYRLPSPVSGRLRYGGRNVTIEMIVGAVSPTMKPFTMGINGGRTMLDKTGLSGRFDFTLEWSPEASGPDAQPDLSGPPFEDALLRQLGIKLQPQKGSVSVLVIDHVERPSEN